VLIFIIQQHIDTQSMWCGQYHLFYDFCCFWCVSPWMRR